MVTKADLLGKSTLHTTEVAISNGKTVRVREMNGREREEFFEAVTGSQAVIPPGLQARMVRWCVVDDNLDPVFEESDEEKIAEMGGRDLQAILDAVMNVSGVTDESVEEIEGN